MRKNIPYTEINKLPDGYSLELLEKMSDNEIFEILLGNIDYKDYSSKTMTLVNKCIQRIWKTLEEKEQLKEQNDRLAINSGELVVKVCKLKEKK